MEVTGGAPGGGPGGLPRAAIICGFPAPDISGGREAPDPALEGGGPVGGGPGGFLGIPFGCILEDTCLGNV